MTSPAKFMFDNEFGAFAKPKDTEPKITVAEHEALLAAAEAAAYARGHAQATDEIMGGIERATQLNIEQVSAQLARLSGDIGDIESRLEGEAVEVALSVARQLAAALVAREPMAEISALVGDCLREVRAVPHLVVRVQDDLLEPVRQHLEVLAREHGFTGRLVVLAEPHLRPGDCRIEWADGGMALDSAAVEATINRAIQSYLSGRDSGLAPLPRP